MQTFFVDEPVSSFLEYCSENKSPIDGVRLTTSSKMMLFSYIDKNKEHKSFTFNLEEDTFNIHSNGHHLGKFSHDGDKIVVKWPNKLTKFEKGSIITETQEFFRKIQ